MRNKKRYEQPTGDFSLYENMPDTHEWPSYDTGVAQDIDLPTFPLSDTLEQQSKNFACLKKMIIQILQEEHNMDLSQANQVANLTANGIVRNMRDMVQRALRIMENKPTVSTIERLSDPSSSFN